MFYTYVCGEMQWSATRSGSYAVVGFNGGFTTSLNHAASGFSLIAESVSCIPKHGSRRRRNIPVGPIFVDNGQRLCGNVSGGVGSGGLGGDGDGNVQKFKVGGNLSDLNYTMCTSFANCDAERSEVTAAHKAIPSCPDTITQLNQDDRFLRQPDTTDCYVWAFAILRGGTVAGSGRSYTRQCCYRQ